LIEATTSQRCTYKALTIEYRCKTEDSSIFLITDRTGEVIAQMRIPQKLLERGVLLNILNFQGLSSYNLQKRGKYNKNVWY